MQIKQDLCFCFQCKIKPIYKPDILKKIYIVDRKFDIE